MWTLSLSELSRWNPVAFIRRYVKAHHVSRAALILAGTAAAILFFIIGAGIRLLIGPVSLGPLGGTLADALARALPGITVKYDQAAIEWARDEGRVNLVILGARVFDAEGRIIAQAPKADIDLAATPFLQGKIEVKRIILVGVQLTLVRTAEGGLRLGVEKDKLEHDILSRIQDAIAANDGKTSSLESFAIHNARLAFFDETTGLFVVAPQADFRLERQGANLDARLDAAIEISGHPAHIGAEVTFPPNKGKVAGALTISGFQLGALASNSQTFAAVKDTALKIDLTASFVADGTRLVSVDFGVGANGSFRIPGSKDGPVRVRDMRAIGRYDGATGRLLFEDAAIDADKIAGRFQGRADFITDSTNKIARINADLRITKLSLAFPKYFAQPVSFSLVDIRGSWLPETRDLVFDHLGVTGASLNLQASGKLTFVPNLSPALETKGTFAAMNVRDLVHYWPLLAAGGARSWVEANMFAGTIGPIVFETHLTPGMIDAPSLPDNALSAKFALLGGEANYIKGLTHLTEIQAAAKLTGASFALEVSSAKIGPLVLTGGRFAIPDLNVANEIGEITGHMKGSMSDVLALVDMPPLGYPTRFGIGAADSKGAAALDISVQVPMQHTVSVDQVAVAVKAAVSGFAISLGPHTRMTDGTIAFSVDNSKLHATGTTGIGGSASRIAVDWTEDFKTVGAVTTKIAVKGMVDDQARAAMNLHTKDFLRGPIGINGMLTGHRGALLQANATLDLTPVTVTLDLIGLNKPAGFPATAHLVTTFGPHSTIAGENLQVTGPGILVIATTAYDKNGKLIQLQAPSIHVGQQDDFSLNLTRNASGVDIAVHGHSLDGSRLAGHGGGQDEETIDEPFHISAKLDRLALRNGIAIAPFAIDTTGIADRPSTMTLSGSLSKTGTLNGSIVPVNSGRRFTVTTNDMATLSKGLFGFNSMRGGKLDFAAILPGKAGDPPPKDPNAPDFQGRMILKDFRIVDQPFLEKIFTAGSLTGLINLMQGQGVAVDTLEVPFSSHDGVITVRNARATGPAIGITAEGYIDRGKNDIGLKGSLVPLFGINSVLGEIPLLGDVLTSKQGEGIIGMTYSVSGNADEPSVSVNPLSALAPGIVRRIFEGKMPMPQSAPPPKAGTPAPSNGSAVPPNQAPAPSTATPKGQ